MFNLKEARKFPFIPLVGFIIVLLIAAFFFVPKIFPPAGTEEQQMASLPFPKQAKQPRLTAPASWQAEPEPEPERPPLESPPVQMSIPALEIDAEIQDTGADATGTMEIVPSASIISWFRESAIPGNEGNSFLGGHNKWGGKPGHLLYLDTLNIGDEMIIEYADGSSLVFRLESVFVYALATAPADLIMNPGGEARVTVITCKEPFNPKTGTSDNRIVAIFKEDRVFEIPDPPILPFPILEP